jgi:hypothetical protein
MSAGNTANANGAGSLHRSNLALDLAQAKQIQVERRWHCGQQSNLLNLLQIQAEAEHEP